MPQVHTVLGPVDAGDLGLTLIQEHGVKTVVEPTAMMLGRDVPFLIRLAQETGLHIVPCTGIYTYDHLPMFFQNRDEDFMADCFVHDIENGIQGTDVKAA